ncbi:hypothetical protein JCM5353_004093 [Sporobolomyces roseus]
MDLPLNVKIIVYDLLPPSKLSSILNFVGTGVYHTSVELTIPIGPTDKHPLPLEYAFGGHDSCVTGIFSIPAGTATQRMPGLRYYRTHDMGEAFGEEWKKLYGSSKREEARPRRLRKQSSKASLLSKTTTNRNDDEGETTTARPYEGYLDHSSSTTSLATTFVDSNDQDDWEDDDGGYSDGTEYLSRPQRRAWRIIQQMKRDPNWHGTNYNLLQRNCNSFTDELVRRLTGRPAPYWINRAAFIATSFPCIVPSGFIDETEEAVPTAGSTSATIDDPAHLVSNSGEVKIQPPRADRMGM